MDSMEGHSYRPQEELEPPVLLEALHEADTTFRAVEPEKPEEPFNPTPEQIQEIKYKLHILSSLAQFIGKDFQMPVELNEPGAGWHWDFKANKVRVDPKDLLEKPLDYLRFVISHEGGHRRISRTDFIPLEQWQEPGFGFMMNVIEDPRDNNFVAESYPKFREQMELAYQADADFEQKAKSNAKDKLGFQPRFIQAGFEYIKQWFREAQGQDFAINPDLPPEVQATVAKTLPAAQDSWWQYPDRDMANGTKYVVVPDGREITGEELIQEFAKFSYEINRTEVWPECKKLIEQDLQDQETQEALQDMQQPGESGEGDGQGIPQKLKDQLTPEEQAELEKAIEEAIDRAKQQAEQQGQPSQASPEQSGEPQAGDGEPNPVPGRPAEGGKPQPIDLDALSDGLKQKLQDYIDSLPPEQQKALAERAEKAIKEIEQQLNEELAGKLVEDPDQRGEQDAQDAAQGQSQEPVSGGPQQPVSESEDSIEATKLPVDSKALEDYRKLIEQELHKNETVYEQYRREVLPIIDQLEHELRDIFVRRRTHPWESGHKSGKRIGMNRRMQEKAKGISPVESKAWERREHPQEKDYAITLLVDLSGSMQGRKIEETFKAVIVLAEVLNRLSLKVEVLGFNDRLHEYQPYGTPFSDQIRSPMGGMLEEVESERGRWNDDGWAVGEAAIRLARQQAQEKFLIVLSDGIPEPSSRHSGPPYELKSVVDRITEETRQKLIGLGIGPNTDHVGRYYPNSLANVSLREMAEKIADLLRAVITEYNTF